MGELSLIAQGISNIFLLCTIQFSPRIVCRLETGATVASLRTASILLKNVGTKDSITEQIATPYRLSECYVAVSPGRSMSLDQLLSLGLRAGLEEGRSPSIPTKSKGNPGKRSRGSENSQGSPGKRMPNSSGKRSLGNLKKRSSSGVENPLNKRARSCATSRRIYSEEDPVEEEVDESEKRQNSKQMRKDVEKVLGSGGGIEGAGSDCEEENAATLEIIPKDGTENFADAEVAAAASEIGAGQSNTKKGQSTSRGTSREFSRQGRVRNSVVYTESPVIEKKRISKREEGSRMNTKSGRVSPLDMNTVDHVEEEMLQKKKSIISGQNIKKNKEESSKKVSLVRAGGSKRTTEVADGKAEKGEIADSSEVKKTEDLASSSLSRESDANVVNTEEASTSRGRRARAQVSFRFRSPFWVISFFTIKGPPCLGPPFQLGPLSMWTQCLFTVRRYNTTNHMSANNNSHMLSHQVSYALPSLNSKMRRNQ